MPVDIGIPDVSPQKMQGPAYIRPELREAIKGYLLIRDVLSGEETVKKGKGKYLPFPNKSDQSPENIDRYNAYLARAVWYPATERTVQGMVGLVFLRDPTYKLPGQLAQLEEDASGDGQTLEQVARLIVTYQICYGRAGVLADYPNTQGQGATQAQVEAGDVRPVIRVFDPWAVINWRTEMRGSQERLSLVVIFEAFEVEDDGFERKYEAQLRELRMIDGKCYCTVWQRQGQLNWVAMEGPYTYTDGTGAPLDHIPFKFAGAINNNATIDKAPIDGLARLNLAHYRNSADYEESVFLVGQPTPVFSGLTKEWVDDVFKGKVMLGSRSAIPLPPLASAILLQADPNTLAKEAMDVKERQMVALGAKLVQQAEVQRTATESDIESTAENSLLSSIAKNAKAVMHWALGECALFANAGDGYDFDLSTEFDLARLDPAERAQLIKEWQSGAIAFEEMRENLRKAGIASLSDAVAKTKIAAETADAAAAAMALAQQSGAMPGGGAPKGLPGGGPAPKPAPKPAPAGT